MFIREPWREAVSLITASNLKWGKASGPVSFSVAPGRMTVVTGYSGSEGEDLLQVMAGIRKPSGGSIEICGAIPGAFQTAPGALFLSAAPSLDPTRPAYRQLLSRLSACGRPRTAVRGELDDWLARSGLEKEARIRSGRLPGWIPRFMTLALPALLSPRVLAVCEPLEGVPLVRIPDVVGILVDARTAGCAVAVLSVNPGELAAEADSIVSIGATG